jgi:FG-GAP-like repeat
LVEPGSLYRNVRGNFREVARGTFARKDRHHCAFADVNRDHRPDAFCTLGADRGKGVKTDELWLQRPGHRFVDRAAEYGVMDPYGRGRYAAFLDINRDGFLDLFVGNAAPRADTHTSPNRLFLNVGGKRFRDVPQYHLDHETGNFCAQAADVDRDGWTDLLLCGNEGLRLFRNSKGRTLVDVTRRMDVLGRQPGVTPPRPKLTRAQLVNAPQPPWLAARLIDLNRDGRLDLLALGRNGLVSQFGRADGFGPPSVIGHLTSGFALATGDVDRDKDPDVYVVQTCPDVRGRALDEPDFLLRNDGTGRRFRYVRVPPLKSGCGQAASAIDYNRDGRTEFVVLNGRDRFTGPVQVLRFVRRH